MSYTSTDVNLGPRARLPAPRASLLEAQAPALPGRRLWRDAGQTPALRGQALLQRIEADLPRLSPQLLKVAAQLVRERGLTHRDRITDFARLTDTAPVTVVRLAKRYGFQGFYELKMAFLAEDETPSPASAAEHVRPPEARDTHAPQALKQALQTFRALSSLLDHPGFRQSAQWLAQAEVVRVSSQQPADHLLAVSLVQALRQLGVPAHPVPTGRVETPDCADQGTSLRVHVALAPASDLRWKDKPADEARPTHGPCIVLRRSSSPGITRDARGLSFGMGVAADQTAPILMGLVCAWAGALGTLRQR